MLILMSGFVAAAGVSPPCWGGSEPHYCDVQPGESGTKTVILQNMVGEEDVVFVAELKDGAGIVSDGLNDRYLVHFGRSDIPVEVEYSIPADAQPGDEFLVVISFTQEPPEPTGGVDTKVAIQSTLPFRVAPEPIEDVQESPADDGGMSMATFMAILTAMVIVVVVIVLVVRRRSKVVSDANASVSAPSSEKTGVA